MTFKEFNPHGCTGPDNTDMFFRCYITGPDGARYEILREAHHLPQHVGAAKRYIRRRYDPLSIKVINETTVNQPANV